MRSQKTIQTAQSTKTGAWPPSFATLFAETMSDGGVEGQKKGMAQNSLWSDPADVGNGAANLKS